MGNIEKISFSHLQKLNVTDVLVVVVRYFGGIKLGTSGLIAAYREAARLALEEAGIKEMCKKTRLSVDFPYISQEGVMRVAKGEEVEIISREFDNLCRMVIEFPESRKEEIMGKLSKVEGACVEVLPEEA